MKWIENNAEQKIVLQENGDIAAIIQLMDKENITNTFQVKTLISAIYLGKNKFAKENKKKHDWYAVRRKFKTSAEREKYIQRKKKEIEKYIAQRMI